ncbi:hypothetical protein [Actinomyces sp. MRS3W]|uniref:hypothetical protein n=1 Tax=Actinomyces sp. MRS3W TaxID=2800796 RepID=UPI0028FD0FEC|nr:hypothetical protein [Actinomyces sp. MRS3W]MDU0349438.1 hypothetical protein [Actinomyces sp. MRS3W]
MTIDRAEECSHGADALEAQPTPAAEPDDDELALMLATATGMGRAQLRALMERRARRQDNHSSGRTPSSRPAAEA